MSVLYSISTTMKIQALIRHLDSMLEVGATNLHVLVVDDWMAKRYMVNRTLNPHNPCWIGVDPKIEDLEMPSTREVLERYRGKFLSLRLAYNTVKAQSGICPVKSLAIKFGLDNEKELEITEVILADDDIERIYPGLEDELRLRGLLNRIPHITGVWTEAKELEKPQLTGGGWYETFPVMAEGDGITWHYGSHGCLAWFTIDILKRVGYYDNLPATYSYDHSLYSMRCMRASGRTPLLHPQHSRAWKYYCGQKVPIPNNYFDTAESIKKNDVEYHKLFPLIYDGIHIYNGKHGLKDWKIIDA